METIPGKLQSAGGVNVNVPITITRRRIDHDEGGDIGA